MSFEHEEDITGRFYDIALMKRVWTFVRPYRAWLLVCGVLLVIVTVLELIGPYLMKRTIDVYIAAHDMAGVRRMGIAYLGVLLGIFICQFAQLYVLSWTGQRVIFDLRTKLFGHLQGLSLGFFTRNPVGRLMTRVVSDVEVLNDLFTAGIVNVVGDVVVLVGVAGIMLAMNVKLALWCFLSVPLTAYATYLFRKYAVASYRRIRTFLSRVNSILQESIAGMSSIQLFLGEGRNAEKFDKDNRAFRDEFHKTILYHALFGPAITVIAAVAEGVIVWTGGLEILRGVLTVGVVVAFLQYLHRFFRPIQDLAEKYNLIQSAMTSAERVFQMLDTTDTVSQPTVPRRLESGRGDVDFRNVWMSYDQRVWALEDFSLHVKSGERVAIVGPTGSGKTSLVNALTRLYPIQRGEILLQGHGVDAYAVDALRRYIGVILQEPFIFSGTIAENIRLGHEHISPSRVHHVCEELGIDPWIRSLPHGYDEVLRERGNNLSTGQKQLVSFARAMAHDPTILVMDEAASSVDPETEWMIHEAMTRLLTGRTALVIAHRLSTIRGADRIVVLSKGRLQEVGTHQELLARDGAYAVLCRLQALNGHEQRRE